MDTPYIVALLLLPLAFILLTRRRKLNLPPGPKPWPIIGNLNLIGPLPHRSFRDLSNKYGPIMQLQFGSFPVVVGTSTEMAKIFLKTHDIIFSSRPKTAAGKYTTYNYTDITWSPYGPYWRQARKMCLMELFTTKRLDSLEYIRTEETKRFLKGIFDASDSIVSLKDHLLNLSLNVISRMVLGKSYTQDEENRNIVTPKEFREMLDELFLLNGVLDIGDSIPWIRFLDLQGYIKRMKAVSKKFDSFLEHVLDEHDVRRKGVKDYVAKDMVDVLLQLAEDTTKVKLERDGVKAFTQDLIAAATESSAVTVEWAIAEMLNIPEIFTKATEELDRVIGKDRWVEEKDMANLPYIYSIAKEALRLHPVAPMLVPHMATEDCKVAGYDISKDTRVFVNVWAIARDPTIWEKPEEFWPERYVEKDVDVKGNHYELLPFGAGRRICPGWTLGMKVLLLSLSNLLHGFNIKKPGNMKDKDVSMEEIFGLSLHRKYPLEVEVELRLAPHMYNW